MKQKDTTLAVTPKRKWFVRKVLSNKFDIGLIYCILVIHLCFAVSQNVNLGRYMRVGYREIRKYFAATLRLNANCNTNVTFLVLEMCYKLFGYSVHNDGGLYRLLYRQYISE